MIKSILDNYFTNILIKITKQRLLKYYLNFTFENTKKSITIYANYKEDFKKLEKPFQIITVVKSEWYEYMSNIEEWIKYIDNIIHIHESKY